MIAYYHKPKRTLPRTKPPTTGAVPPHLGTLFSKGGDWSSSLVHFPTYKIKKKKWGDPLAGSPDFIISRRQQGPEARQREEGGVSLASANLHPRTFLGL